MMSFERFCQRNAGLMLAACLVSVPCALLRAGSDLPPAAPAQELHPLAVQMDEYLKAQRIDHAIESPTPANGQQTTVKIYGVAALPQQETLCAGLSAGGKHERLQGVSVQFLTLETQPAGSVAQVFQPSGLPSGNGNVINTQRPVEKSAYRLQRTVKLQDLAAK